MEIIPQKYAYLAGSLYFLAVWLAFFWKWPNRRLPMATIGAFFIGLGLFAEYFWWLSDWWHPKTFTGTKIGIEDIILSFTLPGISVLIYKFFFKKDLDGKFELDKGTFIAAAQRYLPIFLISFVSAIILFSAFHVHSVISTSVGMMIASLMVMIRRKDLLPAMLWSAFLMVVVSIPAYFIFIFLSPGSIDAFWNFSQITGYKLTGIPIEDILWFALAGFLMGGIVEYGFDYRLVDEKNARYEA
ncbi:MAG: lycopene cyclase domain-containing protein [Candidatus Moranbacteria bacterium]|nr:lycopene cyclase domain-containing protein [Candidatus Moranbacteria bacterium]